jgi:hypothetical protein
MHKIGRLFVFHEITDLPYSVSVRYFLNVIFNILNKKIYNYFPYP